MKIIIGDSIALGCWGKKGGWADMLKSRLAQDEEIVYNISVDGATIMDFFNRQREVFVRIPPGELVEFIVALGINDSAMESIDDFGTLYNMLIKYLKSYNPVNIYCVGLTCVDERKTNPVKWDRKLHYRNSDIGLFNYRINQIAQRTASKYIPVLFSLTPADLYDGVHPNEKGHMKLFKKISRALNL